VSVGAEDQRGVCVVEQRPHRFARGRQLRAGLQRTPDTHGRGGGTRARVPAKSTPT